MRRQDELERDRLRIEDQKRAQLALIEQRNRTLTKERERARLANQVCVALHGHFPSRALLAPIPHTHARDA